MNQPPPIKRLQEKRDRLIARFLKGDERDFWERHSRILDEYFHESFSRSSVGPDIRLDKNPCAIIALGGYGRKAQSIFSDVDVLLLFAKKIPDHAKDLVQEIIYPLWDIGLDVGHATRSFSECLRLAAQDFEVLTSLLDARFLCGISSLYYNFMNKLHDKVLRRLKSSYVDWLSEKNRDRHIQFGDSTYLLEPNLKEGMGGLRDYHVILWAARAIYKIVEPRDLEFLGHLSHDEFESLSEAVSFVRHVRNWLHHLSRRKCDQLYFQYQVELAEALGFRPENGQQAVERFLGTLHRQMEFVKRQSLFFMNKVLQAKSKSSKKKTCPRVLKTGITLVQDTLDFESPEAMLRNPNLLIEIFEISATLEKPLSAGASRLVKEFLYLVDETLQKSPSVTKSFERILATPTQTFNVLNEMFNTGMMAALIPEIKGIVDRIQYDEYHLYPVDKHLLRTVQILKELRDAAPESKDHFYAKIFGEVCNPVPLLWAGLLHDVGKGNSYTEPDDHAGQGAQIVSRVFDRMDFSNRDIKTISFLVREHLFLIQTATRRDIRDEKTVINCARRFPDIDHLRMLYLLTVADSKATGPMAWNEWKATLLRELFFKVYHMVEKGELVTSEASALLEGKRKNLFQSAVSVPRDELETLFGHLSPRYLLYTTTEDMLRHIDLYKRLGHDLSILEAETNPNTNYRTVTLCARNVPGLFSKIAGVLALNSLDIMSAEIYTWSNHIALDIFIVKAPSHRFREDRIWERVNKELRAALEGKLSLSTALDQKVSAYQGARKKIPRKADEIVIDNETSGFFSIIEVFTHDSRGLLYRITDALFRCKLDIWVAKIGTKVDQVVDVFYVRDFDGQKLDSPELVDAIKKAIKGVLDSGPRGHIRSRKKGIE